MYRTISALFWVCALLYAAAFAQPQNFQAAPIRVRVAEAVAQQLLVHRVAPEYPARARAECIQGSVVLQVEIAVDGQVSNATFIDGPELDACRRT